jgi:LysR family transcriptional regulator, benzoate and cis,cis-muconate-responsive activator of ben and cat genes
MELRHLRYFLAVAEELNFSRAAVRLHVAQPALSRQIRDLEFELGVTLFSREGGKVALTDAGLSFQEDARKVVEQSQEAMRRAQQSQRGAQERLRIGYQASLFQQVIAMALQRFHQHFPGVSLELSEMNPAEQGRALAAGELDVGLIGLENEAKRLKLPHESFMKMNLCIALPKAHPAARKSKVSLASLAGDFFIGISEKTTPGAWDMAVKLCAQANFRPRYLQVTENAFVAMSLVSTGCAVAFATEPMKAVAWEGVVIRPLDPPLQLEAHVAWKRDTPTVAMKEFIRILKEVAV